MLAAAMPLGACGQGGPPSGGPEATQGPSHGGTPSPTGAVASSSPTTGPSTGPTGTKLRVGGPAWVAVSVATVWRSPDSPRAVDAPALSRPARIDQWLAGLSVEQRRALNGRADTQALLGDEVVVVSLVPGWAQVVVPAQPTPVDTRGYPGWVPQRQLTATPPLITDRVATVTTRTTWLRSDRDGGRRLFRISYGTRLPLLGLRDEDVRVATPTGRPGWVAAGSVRLHRPAEPALPPSRESLVAAARSFVGLPYLWAGTSGFGLDCSGLTWLVHRVHGVAIPRDAAPQSEQGAPVARLMPGDLMFYAASGSVHHVSTYLGDGRMVHAPGTGEPVEVVATTTEPYRAEFLHARRYLR